MRTFILFMIMIISLGGNVDARSRTQARRGSTDYSTSTTSTRGTTGGTEPMSSCTPGYFYTTRCQKLYCIDGPLNYSQRYITPEGTTLREPSILNAVTNDVLNISHDTPCFDVIFQNCMSGYLYMNNECVQEVTSCPTGYAIQNNTCVALPTCSWSLDQTGVETIGTAEFGNCVGQKITSCKPGFEIKGSASAQKCVKSIASECVYTIPSNGVYKWGKTFDPRNNCSITVPIACQPGYALSPAQPKPHPNARCHKKKSARRTGGR